MLEQFLITELYAYLLIFCRLGAAVMLLPGIGEIYVPARIRLLFALALSLLMMPLLSPLMPTPPTAVSMVFLQVFAELLAGLFFGALTRILISAMHTAGSTIAMQSGLASAMMLDINQTTQSTAITNLLTITALMVFFATDLHHAVLHAVAQSYDLFQPGIILPVGDSAYYMASTVARTFAVGVQLASPHIVLGLTMYLGAGVLARLMPAMQIFFILLAPQIMIALFLLMVMLGAIMAWYAGYLENVLGNFMGGA